MNEAERDRLDWLENQALAEGKDVTSRASAWVATVAAAVLATFLCVAV